MKEYCIYRQIGNGCPFRLNSYKNLKEAQEALFIIIEDYEYKNKNFYVDNDFFENKFQLGLPNQLYFQIQEREVTNWKETKEYKPQNKLQNKLQKNNVIKINFY